MNIVWGCYERALFRFLLAAVTAFGCVAALTPPAHAVTNTPLDCPGVVTARGGYRLVQDSDCGRSLLWYEDNKFFDLGRFTFKVNSIETRGADLNIRNGTLKTNGIYWIDANGTLSNLRVTIADTPLGFFIEAGSNFTVKNSAFENIPGVALSFYFGNGGTVRNSVFTGNWSAISIQRSSDVLIENNKFIGNTRGVNLWDENLGGVNNNTISHNVFRENGTGINIDTHPGGFPALQGNKIVNNNFIRSGYSGILIKVKCEDQALFGLPPDVICSAQDTVVRGNTFNQGGFALPTNSPYDDGVTARASIAEFPSLETPYPDGLVGVTLSNNRADRNADLGFDVAGVTDGGGNSAKFNGNPAQCDGLDCKVKVKSVKSASLRASLGDSFMAIPEPPVEFDQLQHTEAGLPGF